MTDTRTLGPGAPTINLSGTLVSLVALANAVIVRRSSTIHLVPSAACQAPQLLAVLPLPEETLTAITVTIHN